MPIKSPQWSSGYGSKLPSLSPPAITSSPSSGFKPSKPSSSGFRSPTLTQSSSGPTTSGPQSVAVIYDPFSYNGGFVYVPAESISPQVYQNRPPGGSWQLTLQNHNIPYAVAGRPETYANLPGTRIDPNFVAGDGVVSSPRNPPRQRVPNPPTPAHRPPPAPGKSSPSFRRRSNSGGLRAGGSVAPATTRLTLGGFDPNPLSIRRSDR